MRFCAGLWTGMDRSPKFRNPVGVVFPWSHGFPRVARSSQPRAGGRNPVGIERPSKRSLHSSGPGPPSAGVWTLCDCGLVPMANARL